MLYEFGVAQYAENDTKKTKTFDKILAKKNLFLNLNRLLKSVWTAKVYVVGGYSHGRRYE